MTKTSFPAEFVKFEKAAPVWVAGREAEMNLWLSFRALTYGGKKAVLRLTGSSAYTVFFDGKFVAFGPARCAHGFYRVDELALPDSDTPAVVTINVAGYNADSFYHIDQPSFLCAELIEDGEISAATDTLAPNFLCRVMTEHEQKTERYSGQRTFCEVYNLSPVYESWYRDAEIDQKAFALVLLERTEEKTFIARGSYYNTYERIFPEKIVSELDFTLVDISDKLNYPVYIVPRNGGTYVGPSKKRYAHGEITTSSFAEGLNIKVESIKNTDEPPTKKTLCAYHGATYKMPYNTTGEFTMHIDCGEDTTVVVNFDEFTGENGLVNNRRLYTVNTLVWRLEKGSYDISTFEPYTMGAFHIYVTKGKAEISDVALRYFGANKTKRRYIGSDPVLAKIFDAAVETYRQNIFTIYMDCPSRERAGWLCDSFFTSRVERTLTGKSEVERAFLENFFLPESFKNIPEGMFPQCYPADTGFIPNWAMWLVLELDEYKSRTGDIAFVNAAKPRIYKLLDYFKPFENADGLLERLTGSVFVEWSKANELTKDINYPTNMLYARMLEAVASLYGDREAASKAARIKAKINALALTNSGFYCDNSVYDSNGTAKLSGECTETCQYYAFFTGVATPEKNPELWRAVVEELGPMRVIPGKWPNIKDEAKHKNIYPSNAFIGNFLRFEILHRYGEDERLLCEIKDYFGRMASLTGTLWENSDPAASCDHGFASHIICWLTELGMVE